MAHIGNVNAHFPQVFFKLSDTDGIVKVLGVARVNCNGEKGGGAERLPAYLTRAVQDPITKTFCAQVWDPFVKYEWQNPSPGKRTHPLIYECHIGMAAE